MTRRVLEKLCPCKVCSDFLVPIVRAARLQNEMAPEKFFKYEESRPLCAKVSNGGGGVLSGLVRPDLPFFPAFQFRRLSRDWVGGKIC